MTKTPASDLSIPQRWLHQPINILLIGAGGNGSEVFDGLVKINDALKALQHPGLSVAVIDPDVVSSSNVVRQRFYSHEIGTNKAFSLVHRVNVLHGLGWRGLGRPFTSEDSKLLQWSDIVITAVDTYSARQAMLECRENLDTRNFDRIWIDMGVNKNYGQVVIGNLFQDSLGDPFPNALAYYPHIATEQDTDQEPSCSATESLSRQDLFVNASAALCVATHLWDALRKGKWKFNGGVINLLEQSISPMPFIQTVSTTPS